MTIDPMPEATTVSLTGIAVPEDDHLMRMELAVVVDATPEVVWEAMATGRGLSMWFLESDVEERVGGHVAFHMGPEMASEGEVTAWEPGRRFAYAEPDWVALAGRENTGQQPLVSEFLIEATSGGSAILRVVSSAYGTGAEWEREWFADMVANWAPSFDTLRHYVARHAGQPGRRIGVDVGVTGHAHAVWDQMIGLLGPPEIGSTVRFGESEAIVERHTSEHNVKEMLVRFDGPEHGFGVISAYQIGDGQAALVFSGSLFGTDADQQVDVLQQRWLATVAPLAARFGT